MRTQIVFTISLCAVMASLSANAQTYVLAEPGSIPEPTQTESNTDTEPNDGLAAVISAVAAVEETAPDPKLQQEYRSRAYINATRGSRGDGVRTLSEARRLQFNRLTDDRSSISDRRFKIYERNQATARRQAFGGAAYRSGYTSNAIAQIDRKNYTRPTLADYRRKTKTMQTPATTSPLGLERQYPQTRYTVNTKPKIDYSAVINARKNRTYTPQAYTPGAGFLASQYLQSNEKPFVVTEYFDFGCAYCQRASQVDAQIEEFYGSAVEINKKSFNIFEQSRPVHVVYECLRPQDRHELFASAYFSHFDLGIDIAMKKALEVVDATGYDTEHFQSCTTSGAMDGYLDQQRAMIQAKGVTGTPHYEFPDGTAMPGYQDYEVLMKQIELKRKQ